MNKIKKNVLYVGGFELPDKNAAAQRVLANGKLFNKLGYDVSFLGVNTDQKETKNHKKLLNVDNFEFNSWKQEYPKSYLDWIYFLTDINLVKRIVEDEYNSNLDFIVVYNYPSTALLKLIYYCKKKNIKLVADVTEWYQPKGNIIFRIIKGLDSFLRMRILHKKMDGIIAISKYLFEYYEKSNRIQLPPLIDKKSAKWEGIKLSKCNIRKIVYVGSPGNGLKDRLDRVLLSLSRIKDDINEFDFSIVGISKEEYLNNFGVNSIPNNLLTNVIFEGRKSHNEAIEIIKAADYSIFLRDNNLVNLAGFPTKFVESITCNTPVLTNSVSNIKDFLKNGELGYLIDNSTDERLDKSLVLALNQNIEKINYMKRECFLFNEFHYEYYENKVQQFLCNLNS